MRVPVQMFSKYDTWCKSCFEDIKIGEPVNKMENGQWVCNSCKEKMKFWECQICGKTNLREAPDKIDGKWRCVDCTNTYLKKLL